DGELRRVLVSPHARTAEVTKLAEELRGFIELAVAARDFVAEQSEIHGPREAIEVCRNNGVGVGVTAGRQETAGEENAPVIGRFVIRNGLVARLDALL